MSLLYFYPNRPTLIPPDPNNPLQPKPDYLNSLERSGKYVGEQKWNGDNVQIYTDDLSFWNRTGGRLKYKPPATMIEELKAFPKGCILNAELMHNHTITVKNLLIVHCLMAHKGKPLLGYTWGQAREILEGWKYGEHVKLSPIWKTGFWDLFQKADGKIIEGIVLKDPTGLLRFSTTPLPNDGSVSWMLKVRKTSKKYAY